MNNEAARKWYRIVTAHPKHTPDTETHMFGNIDQLIVDAVWGAETPTPATVDQSVVDAVQGQLGHDVANLDDADDAHGLAPHGWVDADGWADDANDLLRLVAFYEARRAAHEPIDTPSYFLHGLGAVVPAVEPPAEASHFLHDYGAAPTATDFDPLLEQARRAWGSAL